MLYMKKLKKYILFLIVAIIYNNGIHGQDFIDNLLIKHSERLVSFYEGKVPTDDILEYIITPRLLKTCTGDIFTLRATISHAPTGLILSKNDSIEILNLKDHYNEDMMKVIEFLNDCEDKDYNNLFSQMRSIYDSNSRKSKIEKQEERFIAWADNEIKKNTFLVDSLRKVIEIKPDFIDNSFIIDSLLNMNQSILLRKITYK